MCSQACPVAYDHPYHDTHGGSVINDNDQHALDLGKPYIFGDFPAAFAHVHDEPADVTVSDLLSLRARAHWTDYGRAHYDDAVKRADPRVLNSARRIQAALDKHRELSPDERTEFDRRTT